MKKLTLSLLSASLFMAVASLLSAQVIFSEDFSTYSDGNLIGQDGWSVNGSNPSPVVASSVTPPEGGKYLEDGSTANVNAIAIKSYSLSLTDSSVISISYDLNRTVAGGGTTTFG